MRVHKRFKQYVEVNRVKRSMGSSSMSQAKIDRRRSGSELEGSNIDNRLGV